MKDVAAKHHISTGLVGRLVAQYRRESTMVSDQRNLEERKSQMSEQLQVVLERLLA